MATAAATQASLGTSGMNATIILEETATSSGATILTKNYYCIGNADAPGRACWVAITVADSAATQAAAVLTGLRA